MVGSPRRSQRSRRRQDRQSINAVEELGRTAVVVLIDGRPVGVLGLADQLRPDARRTPRPCAASPVDEPVLLTGDNIGAAQVGRTGVQNHGSPFETAAADKVDLLRAIQESGQRVAFVGDGVNDAPALATADVGIAMSHGGSDLALHSSDVVIVHNELATLPAMIDLSRRAHTVVLQNLILAGVAILTLVASTSPGTFRCRSLLSDTKAPRSWWLANGFRLLGTPWYGTRVKAD